MRQSFDLIVLGVGMAAVSAANKCAAAGWSVAVVDELPYGGTCALRGCDPKKMLRRGAEIIDAARLMRGKGIEDAGLRIDWADLVAFKRSFTEKMPRRIEDGLKHHDIATLHGPARFVDRHAIEVNGARLEGRYILIASGAKPRPLNVPGTEYLVDSTRFMELEALPKRILFVGGGFISFEFAHIAARAGSEVIILDHGSKPLKAFDPDLVDKLIERSRAVGIKINLNTQLKSIEKTGDGFTVSAEKDGNDQHWMVDLVVHGAGRMPAIENLNLAAVGVKAGDKGVMVNDYLQSVSNPAIYAAGDAADTPGAPLTPVAVFEGKVAASNMLKGNHTTPDYRGVPTVVFTIPELARVGMLEAEAKHQGREIHVAFTDTSGWYSNMRVGETCAATKIVTDAQTGEILGAHLIGPEYAELINFFGLAIRLGLKTTDLKKMVSAYPTVGSDLGSMF
ncbi:MAG: NAD(P)/FAD-dependent oxidoreductase [Gammaproteobacteria bacterium]|nr:NAD(P)/FAD-dependent oxidoreductase [Gammaproteobacteria bacterium]MDE2023400.1 NAD(P)/FAD-dependent oxidoreductase [Gammaproteobacteria bacterium]MDE2274534.1 NAD(P)/FAD-dependent oxidoreductase [Gammaproteobacteria bacterium]